MAVFKKPDAMNATGRERIVRTKLVFGYSNKNRINKNVIDKK